MGTTAAVTTQAVYTVSVATTVLAAPTTQKPKSRCSAKAAKLRENNMIPLNRQNLPDCVVVRMNTMARKKGCYRPSCWGKTLGFNGHVKTGNGKAGCTGPSCQKCAGIYCDLPPTDS